MKTFVIASLAAAADAYTLGALRGGNTRAPAPKMCRATGKSEPPHSASWEVLLTFCLAALF